MPKYEIKMVVDSEQATQNALKTASAIAKTTEAVNKLTEAEKRNAKSAKESADVFKTALKARNDIADQSGYLSQLSKEAKEHSGVAEAAGKHQSISKLLRDTLKKLGQEVPIVGYALNALKNPFTLIGVAAALAAKTIFDFVRAVDEMANSIRGVQDLQGQIQKTFEIIAEKDVVAKAFEARLAGIGRQAQTTAEWLAEVNQKTEDFFAAQEKRAAASGNDTPEAAARRGRDKGDALILNLRNAARRASAESDAASGALPGARNTLAGAQRQLAEFDTRAGAQGDDAATRKAFLLAQNQEIEGKLGKAFLLRGKLTHDAPFTFLTDEQLRERQADNLAEINSINAGGSIRAKDRVRLQGGVTAAAAGVSHFENVAESGAQAARNFNQQAASAARVSNTANADSIGLSTAQSQFAQGRFDIQRAAIGQRTGRPAFNSDIEASMTELIAAFRFLARATNTVAGNIGNDPKVKAASQNAR